MREGFMEQPIYLEFPEKSVRLCRAGFCPSLFNIFIINLGNGMESRFVKLTGDVESGETADAWGGRTECFPKILHFHLGTLQW